MASALPSPWLPVPGIAPTESGQAHVFKVRRPDDDTAYALKRLKNIDRRGRFDREIDVMRELSATEPPIVPAIVASGVDTKQRPYYVMPWYEEGSLENAALQGRFTDPVVGIRALLQLVDAMEALHLSGWTHRDLKPANILLDGDGLVLCDLGLAIPAELDSEMARLTDTLEAVGSRHYIAPENESGISDEVDQRPADFYAFAKISWVLMTGRPPLARESQLVQEHRVATIMNEERLAPWDQVCDQLLSLDPRARLDDWAAVRTELNSILSKYTVLSDDPPRTASQLEELEAAARRYARSSVASEIRNSQAAREKHHQQVQELRQIVSDAAAAHAAEGMDIHGFTGGLAQANLGDRSDNTLWIQIAKGALEGLPDLAEHAWDEQCLRSSSAMSFAVEGLSDPAPPSVVLGGYVLADQAHAWMLRVPFLRTPDIFLLPTLTARFRSVSGPYRLGLPSARDAARDLGEDVYTTGLILAREYIDLLTTGRPVHDPDSWLADT